MERRNEVDVLHVTMDVKSAQDFLAMVAEKGEAMVEVQDLLAFARPWITDWPEHLVYDAKKKIDVPATVALWRFLSKLR